MLEHNTNMIDTSQTPNGTGQDPGPIPLATPPTGGPPGTKLHLGPHGPQVVRSSGARWTEEAEKVFFDHLAASCNVRLAAEACGFKPTSIYGRRRRHPHFAQRWQAALEQGYARIEMALVRRAADALEGLAPDPDTPIPEMSVSEALAVLKNHGASVQAGTRNSNHWRRPRSLDELAGSILRKLEAVAPAAQTPSAAEVLSSAKGADDAVPR